MLEAPSQKPKLFITSEWLYEVSCCVAPSYDNFQERVHLYRLSTERQIYSHKQEPVRGCRDNPVETISTKELRLTKKLTFSLPSNVSCLVDDNASGPYQADSAP